MHATKALSLTLAVLSLGVVPASADEVVRWNRIVTEAIASAKMDPLTASRILAIYPSTHTVLAAAAVARARAHFFGTDSSASP